MFNFFASKQGLNWEADSKGLAVGRGGKNVGPISPYTIEALSKHSINIPEDEKFPQQAKNGDFQTSTRVIALDESEHRPLMNQYFSEWTDNIEYWLVHDIDKTDPVAALGEIEQKTQQLIAKLLGH
jgi:protein-tyrosine phosphatase